MRPELQESEKVHYSSAVGVLVENVWLSTKDRSVKNITCKPCRHRPSPPATLGKTPTRAMLKPYAKMNIVIITQLKRTPEELASQLTVTVYYLTSTWRGQPGHTKRSPRCANILVIRFSLEVTVLLFAFRAVFVTLYSRSQLIRYTTPL
jgi:hypothetical protein